MFKSFSSGRVLKLKEGLRCLQKAPTRKIALSDSYKKLSESAAKLGLRGEFGTSLVDVQADVRKDWDLVLPDATQQLSTQIISHLRYSPIKLIFGMPRELTSTTFLLRNQHIEQPSITRAVHTIATLSVNQQAAMVVERLSSLSKIREEGRQLHFI